jgi:hypothetical protein
MVKFQEKILFPNDLLVFVSKNDSLGKFVYKKTKENCFHYEIIIPKKWETTGVSEIDFKQGLIAKFSLQSGSSSQIKIYVNHLWREFSSNEWIENKLISLGHKIIFRKDAYGIVGGVSDFLTQRQEADNANYFIRTTMAKDGNRLFRVECWAEESEYPKLAEDFLITLSSFKLLSPENIPTAEPLTDFQDIVPVIWGFKYPASWNAVKESLSQNESKIRLDNFYEEKCIGRIYLTNSEKKHKSSQILTREFFELQEKAGIITKDVNFEIEDSFNEFTKVNSSVSLGRVKDNSSFEVRTLSLSNDETSVLIGLVSPTRNEASDWWAVNKRCFEIIKQTIFTIV